MISLCDLQVVKTVHMLHIYTFRTGEKHCNEYKYRYVQYIQCNS